MLHKHGALPPKQTPPRARPQYTRARHNRQNRTNIETGIPLRPNKRPKSHAGSDCGGQSIDRVNSNDNSPPSAHTSIGEHQAIAESPLTPSSPAASPRAASRKRPASLVSQDEKFNCPPVSFPSPGRENGTFQFRRPMLSESNLADNEKRFRQQEEMRCDSAPRDTRPQLLALPERASPRQAPELNFQSSSPPPGNDIIDETSTVEAQVFKQPETRPITEEQLINEVQGIYAGLVMVEKKCIEMDQQLLSGTNHLTNEQWGALIALHRTLLHEHHDFFLASQHPSSSERLRKLATKYAMPARMWRHGIHAFLELLRHQLPASLEHMLSFIYTAYSMMTLLMESVPIFVDTWIECLGDLARYRMAVEDIDREDRDIWAGVAGYWYRIAADKSPNVGRIQHHLAVLARPLLLDQLFYYTKSLVCAQPFTNTRESILLLFNPLPDCPAGKSSTFIYPFVKAHATLFGKQSILTFLDFSGEFLTHLSSQINTTWRDQGMHVASINFTALLEYGADGIFMKSFMDTLQLPDSRLDTARRFWRDSPLFRQNAANHRFETLNSEANFTSSLDMVSYGSFLTCQTMTTILKRIGDKNILPYMHISLSFLWSLAQIPETMKYIETDIPWRALVIFLNTLNRQGIGQSRLVSDDFPMDGSGFPCHLPEDFTMRGQIWSQLYYPDGFFDEPLLNNEERLLELSSIAPQRTTRCLWLGCRIASFGRWISYNSEEQRFYHTDFAMELEQESKRASILDTIPRLLAERRAREKKDVEVT